jgi:AMMECR1 domain-containing protein
MGSAHKASPLIHPAAGKSVNLTIRNHGRLRGSMSGHGPTLAEAVVVAASRAAHDERFRPSLSLIELPEINLELWVLKRTKPLSIKALGTLDLGLYGIALQRGSSFAYYKPSVPLTIGTTDHVLLLQKLAKKAGLAPEIWRDAGTVLRRSIWDHYAEGGTKDSKVLRLRRLRPLKTPELTAQVLLERVRLAQDRLLAVQLDNGLYLYECHPFTQKASGNKMHLVRQAGCAYAIAAAAAQEQDEKRAALLEQSALSAVELLMSCGSWTANSFHLVQPGTTPRSPHRSKLGALALLLLALQFRRFPQKFQRERRSLAVAILSLQNGDGSFRCYLDSTSSVSDGNAQNFFPGEALLALVHEGRRGHADCGDAVGRAFGWYREYFRQAPSAAFILWQVDTWRLVCEWAKEAGESSSVDPAIYADFVFEMVDWLLQFQLGANTRPWDCAGGYSKEGSTPGFSTATYAEAMIRAYGLSRLLGQRERMLRYRESSLLALRFLCRLQVVPETSFLFRDPVRAIGGTTRTLKDFSMRSDFDQHVITALLSALETSDLVTEA